MILELAVRPSMTLKVDGTDYVLEFPLSAVVAARKAYNFGLSIGGPAGFILGPVMAAAAFTGVMAFAGGGVVPGVGMTDTVPAMLTPGEGIIPGGTMDRLNKMARSGTMNGGNQTHVHVRPTYNLQAMDAAGMDKLLVKHNDVIRKHSLAN